MTPVSRIKRALLAASFFYVCLPTQPAAATACTSKNHGQKVTVKNVIDGDTIELADGRHVRFIGINTPEKKHREGAAEPLANVSTRRLKSAIKRFNWQLLLHPGKQQRDHYGRTLAHPFLPDGTNLVALLLRSGYGIRVAIPPNLAFQDCYLAAEQYARQHKLGVWNHRYFQTRDASGLGIKDTGFMRVQGRVSRIGESRKNFWLNLGPGFALRLPKNKLVYFPTPVHQFKDKLLTVRGWVYYVKDRNELRMNLYHPSMLEAAQPEPDNP